MTSSHKADSDTGFDGWLGTDGFTELFKSCMEC